MNSGLTSSFIPQTFPMKKKRKILIVDDTEINVELLSDILREFRYDTVTAADGVEALAVVGVQNPDLILLDISMPRMDGFEVCERLKANPNTASIPIIIVTAQQDLPTKIKALELGADDFLSKPFNKIELKARVQSLLRIVEMREIIEDSNEQLRFISMNNELVIENIVLGIVPFIESISSSLGTVSTQTNNAEEFKNALNRIQDHTESLKKNIRAIFSSEPKKLKLHRQEFPLRDILRDIVHSFMLLLRTNEKIIENIPPALPSIVADKELINLVIIALLHNAWKYAKKDDKVITLSARLDLKGNIQISVGDNGKGFGVDEIESVFSKVEKIGKNSIQIEHGGSLTLCKNIVELHSGKIWVDSSYGKGAIFSFTLPIK